MPEPDQEPTALELDSVFEEIAALEAQYVAPKAQPEPALAPAEPRRAHSAAPAEPPHQPAVPQPQPDMDRKQGAPVPPGPRSHLNSPSPPLPAAEPFAPDPTGQVRPDRQAEPVHRLVAQATESGSSPTPRQVATTLPDPVFDFTQPAPTRQPDDLLGRTASGRVPPAVPAESLHRPLIPTPEPILADIPKRAAAVSPDPEFDFTPPSPALQAADPFAPVPDAYAPPRPAQPLGQPTSPAVEPAFQKPRQAAPVPPDPLFDFTPAAPTRHDADPFTRAGSTGSRQRYLVWVAVVLAAVLLVLGGRWFYQERNDAASLALVTDQTKAAPKGDGKAPTLANTAKGSVQESGDDAGAAPAPPATRAPAAVPPMVMLERNPPTGAKPARTPEPTAGQDQAGTAPKPEAVANQAPPAPSPKPASRVSARQPAAAAVETGQPEVQDTSMTATLKACRQRGYDAAQCVKRACSMTKYGFACRGQ